MRKLLFILCLLPFVLQGQVVSSSVWFAQAVEEEAGDGIPDVLQNSDSCMVWLEAHADNITIDVGVQQWNDLSGNANHLVQNTDGSQPALQGDSVVFDGSDDWMSVTNTAIDVPATVYLVATQNTWTQYEYFMGGTSGTNFAIGQNGTASPDILVYNGTASSASSDMALGQRTLIIVTFDGSASTLQVDGNTVITGDWGASDPNGVNLGSTSGGARCDVSISACIVMAGHNTSTNMEAIRDYLNDKYGL